MRLRQRKLFRWLILNLGLSIVSVGTVTPIQPYIASFQTPTVQLNKTASVGYQINLTVAESTVSGFSIQLCQTTDKKLFDETNSWQVLNLLSGFCLTTSPSPDEDCKNKPYKGRGNLQFTLVEDTAFNTTGDDTLENFFLCISHTDTTINTICDYSSSFFNISPAVAGTKPVDADSLNTIPTSFPTPTPLAITITSTRSAVLQTQASSTTQSVISQETSADSVTKPKKAFSTAGVIGVAFGVFSLFALVGLICLILLRRSSAKKRSQAAHSANTDSFQYSNFKAEKEITKPPTASSAKWGLRHTRLTKGANEEDNVPGKRFLNKVLTTPQVTTNIKDPLEDNEVHLRDMSHQKSNVKRNSDGSITISPIPSPRSASPLDFYRNDIEVQDESRMNTSSAMGSAAPFLREEGMSAEEMAKIEDEERRIDAAIAAAEAERMQGRR